MFPFIFHTQKFHGCTLRQCSFHSNTRCFCHGSTQLAFHFKMTKHCILAATHVSVLLLQKYAKFDPFRFPQAFLKRKSKVRVQEFAPRAGNLSTYSLVGLHLQVTSRNFLQRQKYSRNQKHLKLYKI